MPNKFFKFFKLFSHLSIRNYVLIKELDIDFHTGLSIITGETGAGKSILLGALGLLTGERADSRDVARRVSTDTTSQKCIIEGTFILHEAEWSSYFEAHDLDYERETVIRREISGDGKSRAFINDSPVNVSALKELGSQLIDIHSQHHNIYLQSPAFQLEIIDRYAQQIEDVSEYTRIYAKYRKIQSELDDLQANAQQQRADLDYHRFRYEELRDAKLQDGELESLEEELTVLSHAEEIKTGMFQVHALLDADELSVMQMLKTTLLTLSKLQKVYAPAEDIKMRAESTSIELRDIAAEAERIAEHIEHDPERLELLYLRRDMLYSLLQKHRVSSIKELIEIRENLVSKIGEINGFDSHIEQLQASVSQHLGRLETMAASISIKRKAAIPAIEEHILSLLAQLGIPYAIFKVDLQPVQLSSNGIDSVRFLFSANRQQNLLELGKVASGGEISRLMLSIKAAISEKIALPTLIFDEIDTGVSGEIAVKTGNIIESMSRFTQIINITHLPQIAAKGQHHYKVYKEDVDSITTYTNVRELTREERITEIAIMLSGEKLTEAAIETARHLLAESK